MNPPDWVRHSAQWLLSSLTVNFESIVDFHLPRRLLAEDRKHEEELVEALRRIKGTSYTEKCLRVRGANQ